MNEKPMKKRFTEKQGQYLAYIQLYQQLHGQAPSEADMQAYFKVTPPSVHRMVVELEQKGLITRKPRTSRSIQLLVDPPNIPKLK